MKVLVTGGAGFIGSHLVDVLLREGHELSILDNLSTGNAENLRKHTNENDLNFVRGDICNPDSVRKAATDPECIIHLAGVVSVPHSIQDPTLTNNVNVRGTFNLLNAAVKAGTRNFIFASTCAIYGEATSNPVTEEAPPKPLSPYALSKLAADQYCDQFHEDYGLNAVRLRLFNVYGPRQASDGYAGVISQFRSRLTKSESPIIYGDGCQTRDFIHVDDVVSVISMMVGQEMNGSYNVGTGKGTTIRSLLETISKLMGKPEASPVFEEARPREIRHSQADIRKLVRKIGYEPRIGLEKGLSRTLGASN